MILQIKLPGKLTILNTQNRYQVIFSMPKEMWSLKKSAM